VLDDLTAVVVIGGGSGVGDVHAEVVGNLATQIIGDGDRDDVGDRVVAGGVVLRAAHGVLVADFARDRVVADDGDFAVGGRDADVRLCRTGELGFGERYVADGDERQATGSADLERAGLRLGGIFTNGDMAGGHAILVGQGAGGCCAKVGIAARPAQTRDLFYRHRRLGIRQAQRGGGFDNGGNTGKAVAAVA